MQVNRHVGYVPKSTAVAQSIHAIHGPCIGCADCKGLCDVLVELMAFPDAILRTKASE